MIAEEKVEDIHFKNNLQMKVYETSAAGNKLEEISNFDILDSFETIQIHPEQTYQTVTGFGGSFTKASASLLSQMSPEKRRHILEAYFGPDGAGYSLTRTHINSCDFSPYNYSYAPEAGDEQLKHFCIAEDKAGLIPMILEAQRYSSEGFKIISSPWTAPPWMKDNNDWIGGKLLPQYYRTWARYFSKYLEAYKKEGIDIWGITVENEPLGNANNWESMHFTPHEMTDFVVNHLSPTLQQHGFKDVKVLGYDQNREELKDWVDAMFRGKSSSNAFDGTALHWYGSTIDHFPEELQYAHHKAPDKYLIQTEACIDAEVPRWKNDNWYWSKGATDWGWDWALADQKHLHPEYVPVFRYATDIIGCLNNWVDGWIDWNMVLDRQGGPNWCKNWCVAPVIVDPKEDEVYFTPLYYVMTHFSKFIRPEAKITEVTCSTDSLQVTSARNPDGSIALVILNQENRRKNINIKLEQQVQAISIRPQALQTILISH